MDISASLGKMFDMAIYPLVSRGYNSRTLLIYICVFALQMTVLHKMGLNINERDARKMIRLLDVSGDELISYEEFRRFACWLPSAQVM